MRKAPFALIFLLGLGLLKACLPGDGAEAPTVLLPVPTSTPIPTAISPTRMPTRTPAPSPTAIKGEPAATFTVVYDNNPYDRRLQTAWGFACWVTTARGGVLFDTGGDGPTLLSNLARLGLDPAAVDAVVLSHAHSDHTGGLMGLLDAGVRPTVYVPTAFPISFREAVRARTNLVEVTGPTEVLPGVYTTGPVGSAIGEQALVVSVDGERVVVTGCAHPGVVEMVRRAKEVAEGEVALVMGGFHLGGASRGQVERIIADLRALGVRRVAPCHCTGDLARQMFADAFGADFFPAGAGWRFTIGASMGGQGRGGHLVRPCHRAYGEGDFVGVWAPVAESRQRQSPLSSPEKGAERMRGR